MNANQFPELREGDAMFCCLSYEDIERALSYFDEAVRMFENGYGEEWPHEEVYGETLLKLFESSEVSPYYNDFTLSVVSSRLPCPEPFIWFHSRVIAGSCSERQGEHDWWCNRIKVSTLRKVMEQRANLSPNEWATGLDAWSRMSDDLSFITTVAAMKLTTLRSLVQQRANLSPNEWAAGLTLEEILLWKSAGRYVSGSDADEPELAAWWAAWSKLYAHKLVSKECWQSAETLPITIVGNDATGVESLTDPLDLDEIRSEYERSRPFDVDAFVKKYGLIALKESPNTNGGRIITLEQCPFNKDHIRSSSILQGVTGSVGFKCFHNSCMGKTWADVIAVFEPGDSDAVQTAPLG